MATTTAELDPSPAEAISSGWNTALDGSGNTYYWNCLGESTYERPADFDEATAHHSAMSDTDHSPAIVPGWALHDEASGWRTAYDRSGKTYYYKDMAGSTYEKPADFDAATATVEPFNRLRSRLDTQPEVGRRAVFRRDRDEPTTAIEAEARAAAAPRPPQSLDLPA